MTEQRCKKQSDQAPTLLSYRSAFKLDFQTKHTHTNTQLAHNNDVSKFNPSRQKYSGTASRGARASFWCLGSARDRWAYTWQSWNSSAYTRSTTETHCPPDKRVEVCRMSCTVRNRSDWWWCAAGTRPRKSSVSTAAFYTNQVWDNGAPLRVKPPGWSPAPRPRLKAVPFPQNWPAVSAVTVPTGLGCIYLGEEWRLEIPRFPWSSPDCRAATRPR